MFVSVQHVYYVLNTRCVSIIPVFIIYEFVIDLVLFDFYVTIKASYEKSILFIIEKTTMKIFYCEIRSAMVAYRATCD